jgi:hypothetical protein
MAISLTQGQAANNGDAPRLHPLPLRRRREQGNDRGMAQDRLILAPNRYPAPAGEIFCRKPHEIADQLPTVRTPVLLAFPPAIV